MAEGGRRTDATAETGRIVLLNDASRVRGGATYLARRLAEELAAKGTPVTFIAGDDGREASPTGVDVLPLNCQRLEHATPSTALLSGIYNRDARDKIRCWISQNDHPTTIYHLHNWAQALSTSVFDALRPVADRTVIHAHDFFLACPNGAFFDYSRREPCARKPLGADCLSTQCDKRNYAHKMWRVARQQVLNTRLRPFLDAAQFVTIYEPMQSYLRKGVAPRRMTSITNPVEPFGPTAVNPEAQRRFAYIGQIQSLKGVFEIAEAGRRAKAPVDFFGDGPARAELADRYPEHKFHGWTSRTKIGEVLQTVRACIAGTLSPEPFCLSAFEALATGAPLIASRAILGAPALEASGGAETFDPTDVAGLADLLAALAGDDDRIARLAAAARRSASRNEDGRLGNTVEAWVDAHCALYGTMVEDAERTAA
ncbi:MAG: glycosyltransferase [Pseudomonadota bacterium]